MHDHKKELLVLSSKKAIDYFTKKQLSCSYVLATSPDVQAFLKLNKIFYYDTTDFFGAADHEKLLLVSHELLGLIKNSLYEGYPTSLINQINIDFICFIRFHLFHYILIACAIDKLDVTQISMDVVFKSETLHLYASRYNLNLNFYGLKVKPSFVSNAAKYIFRMYNHAAIFYINKFLKKQDLVLLPSPLSKYSSIINAIKFDCSYVFFNSNSKDIKSFFKNLFHYKFVKSSYGCFLSKSEYNDAINLASKIRFDQDLRFEFLGFDLKPLLKQFLYGLDDTVVNYMRSEKLLKKIIYQNKICLAVTDHALGVYGQLGEICVANKVPSMLVSHGSHVVKKCPNSKLEWQLHAKTIFNAIFGYLAIQTPYAEKFLANEDEVFGKKIKTGPLVICRAFEKRVRDEKFEMHTKDKVIFLHAGTPKPLSHFRPWIYETVDEYVRNINDIINVVDNHKNAYLAIRFREQKFISLEDFKSLLLPSKNYGIYCDNNLNDYLLYTDYLISYSSTTIEEALHAQVPVIQYDPDGKYHHIEGVNIKRSESFSHSDIYTISSRKDLDWGVKQLIYIANENKNENIDFSKHIMHDKTQNWLEEVLN